MSGIFVIYSARPQKQLVQRRNGYREYAVDTGWAYVREDSNSPDLGRRDAGGVALLPRFIEDVTSVRSDPEATVTFLELKNRESVEDAVASGLRLPLRKDAAHWLAVNAERRPATLL